MFSVRFTALFSLFLLLSAAPRASAQNGIRRARDKSDASNLKDVLPDRPGHPKEAAITQSKPISVNAGLRVPERVGGEGKSTREIIDTIAVEGTEIPAQFAEGRDCAGYLHMSVIKEAMSHGWCVQDETTICEISGCLIKLVGDKLSTVDLIAAEKEDEMMNTKEGETNKDDEGHRQLQYSTHSVKVTVDYSADASSQTVYFSLKPLVTAPLVLNNGPFTTYADDGYGCDFMTCVYSEDVMYGYTDRYWVWHKLQNGYSGVNAATKMSVARKQEGVKPFTLFWRAEGCNQNVLKPYDNKFYCIPPFSSVSASNSVEGGMCLGVDFGVSASVCGSAGYATGITQNTCNYAPYNGVLAIGATGFAMWSVSLGENSNVLSPFQDTTGLHPTNYAGEVWLEVFTDDSRC